MSDPLTVGDRAEQDRFWSHVVRGPGLRDCWIWTGAIADDGYGRWWIRRGHLDRVIRPHRYALAIALGGHLGGTGVAMHLCDNPICVRAEPPAAKTGAVGGAAGEEPLGGRGGWGHVVAGTQSQNLAEMGRKGRGNGWVGPTRAERAARSRALRDAIRGGWDRQAVLDALTRTSEPTLF